MKENKLIPELRYPEFEEEWEENVLLNISTKIGSGKTPKGGEAVYTTNAIPFIRSQNVIDDNLNLDGVCIPEEIHNNMSGSKVLPNDVLLNITGASIGRSCVVPSQFIEGNVNQHVSIIRLKDNSPYFLQALLSSHRGQKLIYQSQTGSGREGLNFESIKKFKIYFPSLPEQEKIASFLTAVDKRIQLLKEKKEKLEAYKKGLMQQLFSAKWEEKDGQRNFIPPTLRFKQADGSDFSDWEEKMAKKVFFSHSNKNHNGDLPILSSSQKYGMIYREDSGIQIQSSEKSVKSYKIVEPGDFVISLRSFQGGIDYSSFRGICSPAYTILKNKEPINDSFYRIYFKKERFIERLSKTTVGIRDGKQITFEAFGGLKIPYPCIEEQKRIAQFLCTIEKDIEITSLSINSFTKFKKGLLQKMFV